MEQPHSGVLLQQIAQIVCLKKEIILKLWLVSQLGEEWGAQAPLFYTNLLLVLVLLCLDSPEAALVRVITFWGLETKAHRENLVAVFTLGKI